MPKTAAAPPPPPRPRRDVRPWWYRAWAPLLIVLAVAAAYANSLSGPFVFDDLPAIVDNPTIRHLDQLGAVLHPPADGSTVTGRPLLNLSFALNSAWGGTNPVGYHVVNLILHTLAALTLFGLVRRTLRRPVFAGRYEESATGLATAAALLWALHPLQTESVTFIVQRAESLMGLCYLATLYGFLRAVDAGGRPTGWLALTVAACALGMTAKEVMVTAPVMVLLYDRTFGAGTFAGAWRRRIFYLVLAATWLPLLWLLAGGGGARGTGAGLGLGVDWWPYALTQCGAIVRYLRLALWPDALVLDYGTGVASGLGDVAPQAMLLGALLVAAIWALVRRPVAGFAGAWFFLILAPSSSFVPVIGQTMAEHRMYLPLAAIVVPAVLGLARLPARFRWPVLAALALAAGALTARRNLDYRDPVTLWRDTARKQPGNYRAHYNLAVELARAPAGRTEAIAEYEKALALEPNYPDAHNNLAVELTQVPGREDEALRHYEAAVRLRPEYAEAHYNLAVELGRRPGRIGEAIAHFEAALRLAPGNAEAHNNLAVALASVPGRLPEAIAQYNAALDLRPDYPEALYGLANAQAVTPGHLEEAVAHYQAALRLRPDYPEAHFALALALARLPGRTADAIGEYEATLRLRPDHHQAHYNLANELARTPARLPEAIGHYEAAVRLKPDFAEARNNLAGAYYRVGRIDDAIQQLTAVLQLTPQNANARRNLEMLQGLRPK